METETVGQKLRWVWIRTVGLLALGMALIALAKVRESSGYPIWGADLILKILIPILGAVLLLSLLFTVVVLFTKGQRRREGND